jgi:hypothetical protein
MLLSILHHQRDAIRIAYNSALLGMHLFRFTHTVTKKTWIAKRLE